ncbi:hypothetical protein FRACYDRAFT_244363 [Fragilariopsis cylindrus CCMP1102]|uniref:RNI-like protein n=1 Tax=Fragilariopsis cylindrus CCMP1102 TaxID=635003 RepID=A0A1E7F2N5_9STRA|nr:hypothetical protein FRACYDRAFT_244363 [Fragilariopsis cylindrus CCMP1102]|eukprot:OEU12103.1 hypothetical protein FRACYDRAFT_244363 [Fragilariopsis cylindrus CCMP1102]
MAPLLLRRSIRNRKIDDDDNNEDDDYGNGNGNGKIGERNGTSKNNKGNSKNKNKKNEPPLAAAATETKKKTPTPSHLPSMKKKKKHVPPSQPVQVKLPQPPAAELAVVSHHHPYMELTYPKRIPTIQQIQRMEESVLLKLIDRSKWRSYPSGPQQCYEKSQTNTNSNPGGSSISSRRITHLKIIDNTFYERLQLILAFRNAAAANRNANNRNNRNHDHLEQLQLPPRILGPRPMWRMTKDIAILDQLQIMELYRCTGRLPKSMNYLNCLQRLQLDGCRNIDLSLLGLGVGNSGCGCDGTQTTAINTNNNNNNSNNNRLHNLMELKITDCEDLTPIKFQNLSNLKRISLMRWDKSNNNTINLGNRWINELSLAVVVSAPAPATTEVSLLASSSSMNDNNNNNVLLPSNEQQQQQQPVVPVQVVRFEFQFRLSLQCITFSGSRLTNKDLSNILFCMLSDNKFPNLHTLVINDNPEINSFMDVLQLPPPPPPSYNNYVPVVPTTMATNLKTIKLSGTRIEVNNEELDSVIYFLEKLYPTVGIMKVFCYGSCMGKDGVVSFRENSPSITHIHNKRMILLPSDQRKKINKIEYLLSMNSTNAFSMTGGGDIRGGGGTRNTTIPGAGAANSTRNEDGRNPLGNSEEMGASALATTTNQGEGVQQRPETIPLSVWPLAIFKAFRKSYRTCNQDSDIRDEDTFKKEIRYDIVYHLLRNGPIFASGQTVRYKRKREYYPRGVKKQIKFTK